MTPKNIGATLLRAGHHLVDAVSDADQVRLALDTEAHRVSFPSDFRHLLSQVSALDLGATYSESGAQAALEANKDWVIAGTNVSNASIQFSPKGGQVLVTGALTGDQVYVVPNSSTVLRSGLKSVAWSFDKEPWLRAIFTRVSPLSIHLSFGFRQTTANFGSFVADDDDKVFFRLAVSSTGDVSARLIVSNGGTDSSEEITGLDFPVNETADAELRVGPDYRARLYVSGALRYESDAKVKKGITNLIPFFHVTTTAADNAECQLHYLKPSQNR